MEEKKIARELKDEELEKVSGGAVDEDIQVYRIGDVFIDKQDGNKAIVLTATTSIFDPMPYKEIEKHGSDWDSRCQRVCYLPWCSISGLYQYSAELTAELKGKINLL